MSRSPSLLEGLGAAVGPPRNGLSDRPSALGPLTRFEPSMILSRTAGRRLWVKRRRTHYEQMFSAVHPITDHSWAGPSKALGETRGLLLSLVGERFEPRANCSASYCARPFVFRTVLKLRSTKLWRKMSSPTANCRLFGNL